MGSPVIPSYHFTTSQQKYVTGWAKTGNFHKVLFCYCTIQYNSTVYSRVYKGMGVGHEKNITQKPASLFPDENEAISVR